MVEGGGLKRALESLTEAGRQHGVDFVRIEPLGSLQGDTLQTVAKQQGVSLQKFEPVQPQHVLELDITPSDEELRKNISQSNRNLINQASARGLSFHISEDPSDVKDFNRIHTLTAQHGGFTNHPDDYYSTLVQTLIEHGVGRLYFVEHAGQRIAAALCYDWNGVRYYAYAGADPEKNRELKAAIYLVWSLIVDAKRLGLARFNYGGVAPEEEPDHPWAGHSRFKRSIGGETLTTAGTWDMPLKTAKYRLYRLMKKVSK
jgi:lipid II:glycine glycyltransferase (peptidoglycan interpeptide bridge formation enzyme)